MIRSELFLKYMQFDINTRRPFKRRFAYFAAVGKVYEPSYSEWNNGAFASAKAAPMPEAEIKGLQTVTAVTQCKDKTLFLSKRLSAIRLPLKITDF